MDPFVSGYFCSTLCSVQQEPIPCHQYLALHCVTQPNLFIYWLLKDIWNSFSELDIFIPPPIFFFLGYASLSTTRIFFFKQMEMKSMAAKCLEM